MLQHSCIAHNYITALCRVIALPLMIHTHLGAQSQLMSYASRKEFSEYHLALPLPFWPCMLSGLLYFILSCCLSLTYGAATEPRASYVLQTYACATRCVLVSWSVRETPHQSIFHNLRNVLTWVLIWVNRKREYLHDFLTC